MKDIILSLLEANDVKNIKISGDEIHCCCPFHKENKPSFSINLETGKYICFSGKCGKKGNLVSFISQMSGKSYKEVENDLQINLENIKHIIDKKHGMFYCKYSNENQSFLTLITFKS